MLTQEHRAEAGYATRGARESFLAGVPGGAPPRNRSSTVFRRKKHGVQAVQEFDAAVHAGRIRETDGFEDFFHFDRLEAERGKVLEALQSVP